MQVKVIGQHLDVTEALRDYINTKFGRLGNHVDDITGIDVTLEVDKLRQIARGNILVKGNKLHAEAEESDMYAAIDLLVDKLDRQAIKHKEKHQGHS